MQSQSNAVLQNRLSRILQNNVQTIEKFAKYLVLEYSFSLVHSICYVISRLPVDIVDGAIAPGQANTFMIQSSI